MLQRNRFSARVLLLILCAGAIAASSACKGGPKPPTGLEPITHLTLTNIRYGRLEVSFPEQVDSQVKMVVEYYDERKNLIECILQRTGPTSFVCPELKDVPIQKQGENLHKVSVSDLARAKVGYSGLEHSCPRCHHQRQQADQD